MTLSRRWVRGAVWVVLVIVGSVLARAQEVSGSINGTVLDAAGASVNGALVTVTNTDRAHVERTVKTDKAGFYTAASLPLGRYSVSIAMKGFKTATVTGLVLNAQDALKVDQKLQVGAATETVNVLANEAALNLENSNSAGLITGTQIRELVLNNRNYEQLLTLQPGVAYGGAGDQLYIGASLPGGTSAQVAFSINGQRSTANNWTIDGADNVDRGANLTLLAYPSVDAISQFVTLRGTYLAEYGRSASGQVNVVTRSGTNDLHGGAYEFFRNNVFNANNYFNKLSSPFTPRSVLRYNDFGFTLGGPVVIPHLYNGKDKTFFFYSMEFRRVVNYATTTVDVPTQNERLGNFGNSAVCASSSSFNLSNGACNQFATSIGSTGFSPTALAYVNDIYGTGTTPKVPYPNPGAGQDPHTLTYNSRNIFNDMQEFARIDHSFGTRVNVFYRYLHDSLPSQEAGGLFVGGGMPGVQTTSTTAPGTQQLGHITVAVHPTLLLDMGYAYSSGAVLSKPIGSAASANSPDIAKGQTLSYPSTLGIVPSITFTGGTSAGGPNAAGISDAGIYRDLDHNHNGFGNITKIVGQHTFKFGMTYNHYQKQENALGNGSPYPQGLFNFGVGTQPTASQLAALGSGVTAASNFDSGFANFLIGNASGGTNSGFQQGSIAANANVNENMVELYAQDDWRATRRLTVNLGVRYSYFGQPYDINNQLTNFSPSTFNAINAQTIDSNGQLCTTAGQTTTTTSGTTTTTTLNNCLNTNGLNAGTPNTIADPLNGIIMGRPLAVLAFNEAAGAPSVSTHGSPFGLEVGHAEKHDWAPRVGFALDVFGDGKTSLRGGYGIAYDDSAVSIYEQEIFNNIPFVSAVAYPAARLDNVSLQNQGAVANLTPPTLRGSPVNYQTPYAQQFSVDLQRAITSTLMLDVGYFGDHGTHLQGVVDINEVQPGLFQQKGIAYDGSGFRNINLGPLCSTAITSACPAGSNGQSSTQNQTASGSYNIFGIPSCSAFTSSACESPLNQIRPYPGYNAINTVRTIFNSNYNALQVKATKKFSGKSLIDVNYTWSKALTNAQTDYSSAAQNSYNFEPEYGRSSYDRNNILTIDTVYELPWMRNQEGLVGHVVGGWELNGIYTIDSGLPLTATMSGGGTIDYHGDTSAYNSTLTNGGLANDSAGLGIIGNSAASLRPTQVLNPNSGYGLMQLKTRTNWFNPTAFIAQPPSAYTVGNERRGVIQGPGFNRLDVGVFRNFRLWHESSFQFRAEGYNVINHTNWASVCSIGTDSSTTCASNSFGQVTATRDPRILQLGGKLSF